MLTGRQRHCEERGQMSLMCQYKAELEYGGSVYMTR